MSYPKLTWEQEGIFKYVKMDGEVLVKLKEDRYLRFTSRAGDARFMGSDWKGIDLGWAYDDRKLAGFVAEKVMFEDDPEQGQFRLTLRGGKPALECHNDIDFVGVWHEEEDCFHFFLTMVFACDLEDLYQNSLGCQRAYETDPNAHPDIQVMDFLAHYSSLTDIGMYGDYPYPHPLYQWFLLSEDGTDWVKVPKVHIPRAGAMEDGVGTDLIHYPSCYGKEGAVFGLTDRDFGGWLVKTLETPGADISYQICWYYYDVHLWARGAVPPRHSCKEISLRYRCEYIPITSEKARQLEAQAQEYNWRDSDLYDVPVFSYDNHFDKILKELPGDKTGQLTFWYQSDRSCRMDHSGGYDGSHCVMIERTSPRPQPSAWYTVTWGIPYDTVQRLGRRYRMSAMVKTEHVTGRARIGKVSRAFGGDIFYGRNTHYADGEPKAKGASVVGVGSNRQEDLYWAFSDSVSGTSDWTEVSVEFDAVDWVINIFLEMSGTGKCWFDNVKLEDIGPSFRKDLCGKPHFPNAEKFMEFWKDYDPAGEI